jgi:O-antigen/teichoic acid export membrane protein
VGASWESAPAPDDPGRNESEAERLDRNLAELLQELRVAGLGVQVLFGFLLSLPFSNRFPQLSSMQRDVYLIGLLLAGVATALLLAPVAYHRLLFRRHEKAELLRVANVSALMGLVAVALAVSASVLVDVSFVERGAVVPTVSVSTFVLFGGLWFALPLWRRAVPRREARSQIDSTYEDLGFSATTESREIR